MRVWAGTFVVLMLCSAAVFAQQPAPSAGATVFCAGAERL